MDFAILFGLSAAIRQGQERFINYLLEKTPLSEEALPSVKVFFNLVISLLSVWSLKINIFEIADFGLEVPVAIEVIVTGLVVSLGSDFFHQLIGLLNVLKGNFSVE